MNQVTKEWLHKYIETQLTNIGGQVEAIKAEAEQKPSADLNDLHTKLSQWEGRIMQLVDLQKTLMIME